MADVSLDGFYPRWVRGTEKIKINTGCVEALYNFTLADATMVMMTTKEKACLDFRDDDELFELLNPKMTTIFKEFIDDTKIMLDTDPFNVYIRDDIFKDLMSALVINIGTWMDNEEIEELVH